MGLYFSAHYWRDLSPSIFLRVSLDPIFLPDFSGWRVPLPALPKALPDSSACYTATVHLTTATATVPPATTTATVSPATTSATVPATTATATVSPSTTSATTTTVSPATTSAGQSWAGQQSGLGCLYFPQTPTRRLEYYVLTIKSSPSHFYVLTITIFQFSSPWFSTNNLTLALICHSI